MQFHDLLNHQAAFRIQTKSFYWYLVSPFRWTCLQGTCFLPNLFTFHAGTPSQLFDNLFKEKKLDIPIKKAKASILNRGNWGAYEKPFLRAEAYLGTYQIS